MTTRLFLEQNIQLFLFITAFLGFQLNVSAQNQTDVLKGKPIISVLSHYNNNLGGTDTEKAFEEFALSRAYLGYTSKLNENFSITALIDITNNGGIYNTYLKKGALTYRKNKLRVDVGLIGTNQFKEQERFWSYRYIYKTFQDAYKYNSSADMGISVRYAILDYLSVDAIIQNGEGYKRIAPNQTYRFGGGLTFTPNEAIVTRVYYDNSPKPNVQRQSFSAFLGYKFENRFRIGAEGNYQMNTRFAKDHNLYGFSVYGRYNIKNNLSVLARYDYHQSNVVNDKIASLAWNVNKDGQLIIVGLDYQIIKQVSVSLNYRYQMRKMKDLNSTNWVYFNMQFKL